MDKPDHGAAAVEFALIVPIFLILVFGGIDYGIFFNNMIASKQGAAEATRNAAVGQFGNSCTNNFSWEVEPSWDIKKLVCSVQDQTSSAVGDRFYKISLPKGWKRGAPIVTCEIVKTKNATGLVPVPNGGTVHTRNVQSIETAKITAMEWGGQTIAPTGEDWSWCDV